VTEKIGLLDRERLPEWEEQIEWFPGQEKQSNIADRV
jgi:hypothetical protein